MENSDFELTDFTPYLLNAAAETQSLRFSNIYKDRYGMLRTEWRVLFHLGRYGPMSAREVSQRARLHKTKVSRAVAALEKKRLLQRHVSETDRRVEILHLRGPGQTVFADLSAAAAAFETALEEELGANSIQHLRAVLRRLGT